MWKWFGFSLFKKNNAQNARSGRKTKNIHHHNDKRMSVDFVTQPVHVVPYVTQVHWLTESVRSYSPEAYLYRQLDWHPGNDLYNPLISNATENEDSEKLPPQASPPPEETESSSESRQDDGAPKISGNKKISASYFPRFIMTVLEALRSLKEESPVCGGYSMNTIINHVKENFIVDGDVDSQVKTALRLAHVSGLVVYLKDYRAYQLAPPEIESMRVSRRRYLRYLRRRRELAEIDTDYLRSDIPECSENEENGEPPKEDLKPSTQPDQSQN